MWIHNVYMYHYRPDNSSQTIWGIQLSSSLYDRCYGASNSCPSISVTRCNHSKDVTVECSKYK